VQRVPPVGLTALRCVWLGRVICHIMAPEVRDYYQLESLWSGHEDDDPSRCAAVGARGRDERCPLTPLGGRQASMEIPDATPDTTADAAATTMARRRGVRK
jgi:hypothetical protein